MLKIFILLLTCYLGNLVHLVRPHRVFFGENIMITLSKSVKLNGYSKLIKICSLSTNLS